MHLKIDALSKSLQTGFIDHSIVSNSEYHPQFLTNDKTSGKKVLSTILGGLQSCDEFWFSVAFVTTSGVATIINTLLELEERGIPGKLLVSQYLNFSQPEALKKLLLFKNIELRIVTNGNFHSKGYLFKKNGFIDLIIGSSNLTAQALSFNKEWNLKISATENSHIIFNALKEFCNEFEKAEIVNTKFIKEYESIYNNQKAEDYLYRQRLEELVIAKALPNSMQIEALANIERLRGEGKDKALLISATGTGKTYLSAFDAKKFNPNKFLFVVHRTTIAEAAMRTFKSVFGNSKTMGLYSGSIREKDKEFLFSTIQTISRDEHLNSFLKDHFDYIVIDESHRAGADSYQKIIDHFKPKFLLGMTATPERTDGFDIFKLFDHTIAYEIRLHKAMEEEMLSPFHYYGITDISVDGKLLDDKADFKKLVSKERVERIVEKTKLYGCDDGIIRGLVFCSRIDECLQLSKEFNERGFKTVALIGDSTDRERSEAISRLESDSAGDKLDYIFTVDIFNEGVDIPRVNQVIMLRPTQSAIVFVQQLGRGLRKVEKKEYLTVIDFIGNYSNNYLVPIALYGDTTYNKDNLRKLIASGSNLIPGSSTINFDRITKERIFESIDSANLHLKKDLVRDYQLLKYRLGHIPTMVDFVEHGCRDPFQFVSYFGSYFNFIITQEAEFQTKLSVEQIKLLELFSLEIGNAKRIEEVIVLQELLSVKRLKIDLITDRLNKEYNRKFSRKTLDSIIRNINFDFVKKSRKIVSISNNEIYFHPDFQTKLENDTFLRYLIDSLNYAKKIYDSQLDNSTFREGFILYQKYSRKDVCRILNWDNNEESTVYGYRIKFDSCPIFVNYHKEDDIASSTKFEDKFLNKYEFQWFSKPRRNLLSNDVKQIRNFNSKLRLPLFIKKSNGEGTDFYYMGDVKPIDTSFEETHLKDDHGKNVSVVKVILSMNDPVEDGIYNYLTERQSDMNIQKDVVEQFEKILPFKFVPADKVQRYINSIPLIDLKVAAGYFQSAHFSGELLWIELPPPFKPSEDYFVCKVIGESMNLLIPHDSWCLFKRDPGGSREGKIVLVQHSHIQDIDFDPGYTVKLYCSKKSVTSELWHHESIILKPQSSNANYKDIIIENNELEELKVLGVLVKVLS